MYEYDYDDDERPRRRWLIGLISLAAAGVGWFVIRPALRDDGSGAAGTIVFDAESSAPPTSAVDETAPPTEVATTSDVLSSDVSTSTSSTTSATLASSQVAPATTVEAAIA